MIRSSVSVVADVAAVASVADENDNETTKAY